jgi:hypothetical protein
MRGQVSLQDQAKTQTRSISLWLDDLRPAPEGWLWVKTVDEAIEVLKNQSVARASLDHDLGEDIPEGYKLCLWMAEHNTWPTQEISVHSQNAVGADRMCGVIERYAEHMRRKGRSRFFYAR